LERDSSAIKCVRLGLNATKKGNGNFQKIVYGFLRLPQLSSDCSPVLPTFSAKLESLRQSTEILVDPQSVLAAAIDIKNALPLAKDKEQMTVGVW
jgi:hypothetical protein